MDLGRESEMHDDEQGRERPYVFGILVIAIAVAILAMIGAQVAKLDMRSEAGYRSLTLIVGTLVVCGIVAIAATSGLLLKQLRLGRRQFEAAGRWNKVSATLAHIPAEGYMPLSREADDALESIGIAAYSRPDALTEEDAVTLLRNQRASRAVSTYVRTLETFAAAVNIGALDEDLAFSAMGHELVAAAGRYEALLVVAADELMGHETARLAGRWSTRLAARREARQEAPAKAEQPAQAAQAAEDVEDVKPE